ncbi:MAG: NAD(P)-dependent oxidoreductase [Acidimicrobiia bacterium]|nr:NAD(P)-dependent oxidoreductase [Acidimicrobiia bacterium]
MRRPAVGIAGLGIMGSAMALNLIRAKYTVIGFDVAAAARRRHRRMGGISARSNRDLGNRSSIVITSLPSSGALLDVARELAAADTPPAVVVETSTLPIDVKERARTLLAARGTTMLDAPLSGTGIQAKHRDIIVVVSGSRAAHRRVVPVLQAVTRAHYYVGAFGAGMQVKFVANLLVAIHTAAAAEAMVLAMKSGLDPAMVLKVVADGGGSSRMLQIRGPLMVKGTYTPAMMKLDVWQKDMTLIAAYARQAACPTPLFNATKPLYAEALRQGRRAEDTAAVCAVLRKMAGPTP